MSPTGTPPPTHLRSARMLDVEAGALVEPGDVLVVDGRIAELRSRRPYPPRPRSSTWATSPSCPGSWTWRSTCSSVDRTIAAP